MNTSELHTYAVRLPNGDSAEADNVEAILYAARTIADEACPSLGAASRLLKGAIVTRDGMYDGLVTTMVHP